MHIFQLRLQLIEQPYDDETDIFETDKCPEPSVVSHDPVYSTTFPVVNVFSNLCEIGGVPVNFMLWPNARLDQSFILDLGCSRPIQKIMLKNTKNRGSNDRYRYSLTRNFIRGQLLFGGLQRHKRLQSGAL